MLLTPKHFVIVIISPRFIISVNALVVSSGSEVIINASIVLNCQFPCCGYLMRSPLMQRNIRSDAGMRMNFAPQIIIIQDLTRKTFSRTVKCPRMLCLDATVDNTSGKCTPKSTPDQATLPHLLHSTPDFQARSASFDVQGPYP